MSTTNVQVPAHIAARIAARAGQKSSIMSAILSDGVSYPRISTRASRFRLVQSGTETVVGTNLDVVIVGSNPTVSKIYFSKPFDNATDTPPDCWSDNGVAPHPDVKAPACVNCGTCPNNVLGSKITPTGAKTKACSDQRHLAVVPAADPTKVYGLTVSVTAMKGIREYFKDLNNYGLVPEEVITELGFDDDASYPKLTFKQKAVGGFVPEAAIPGIEAISKSDDVKLVTRQTQEAPLPQLAAPPVAAAIAAPVAAPAAPIAQAPVLPAAPTPAPVAAPPAPAAAAPVAAPKEENTAVAANSLASMEDKLAALFG